MIYLIYVYGYQDESTAKLSMRNLHKPMILTVAYRLTLDRTVVGSGSGFIESSAFPEVCVQIEAGTFEAERSEVGLQVCSIQLNISIFNYFNYSQLTHYAS